MTTQNQAVRLTLDRWLRFRPRFVILAIGVVMTLAIAWLDHATWSAYSLYVFYVVPITFATWYGDRNLAVLLALTGVLGWMSTDALLTDQPINPLAILWNALVRLAFFLGIIYSVAALRNSYAHKEWLAGTDPLTGLGNVRYFYSQLAREVRLSRRSQHPFLLLYLDLDNFKQVNDQSGHLEGDAVLKEVGRILRGNCREDDTIARLGGDEFGILCPVGDGGSTDAISRKFENLLEASMKKKNWPISFSIGALTVKKFDIPIEAMVARADELMYKVKKAGKGKIIHGSL